jgi:2-polyprenyl-3-methyl-5-hydroxy-6-metoxy-1,4-benzoquinol methylase
LSEYVYGPNERREMLEFIPHGSSVLEIGCGRGGFGLGLRRDRAVSHAVGIEPDPSAAAEARRYFDEVLCGSYPDIMDGHDQKFGCVVFNDVLEHFTDPWQVLRDVSGLLEPGGVVVACIPNARVLNVSLGLLGGDWHYKDQGVLDRTHLRFFTRRSILRMLAEVDYEVELIRPINPLPRYRAAARLLRNGGRVRRNLADLVHVQFAVVAAPRR